MITSKDLLYKALDYDNFWNLSEIDKILCLLIDPRKRKFNEEEIGYVNYDFETLDKESIRKPP